MTDPISTRTPRPVVIVDDFTTAADEALAVVAAGRVLDAERAASADRQRLGLAERIALVIDARVGDLLDDALLAVLVDDVVDALRS